MEACLNAELRLECMDHLQDANSAKCRFTTTPNTKALLHEVFKSWLEHGQKGLDTDSTAEPSSHVVPPQSKSSLFSDAAEDLERAQLVCMISTEGVHKDALEHLLRSEEEMRHISLSQQWKIGSMSEEQQEAQQSCTKELQAANKAIEEIVNEEHLIQQHLLRQIDVARDGEQNECDKVHIESGLRQEFFSECIALRQELEESKRSFNMTPNTQTLLHETIKSWLEIGSQQQPLPTLDQFYASEL